MTEATLGELQHEEISDRLAADWYKEKAGAKPEEILGSLLSAGASIKDYSRLDLDKIGRKERDLIWKPEEVGEPDSRRLFRLRGNAQTSIFSVLKFKYGLEKALVTTSFDGKRSINVYHISYLRTGRMPLPSGQQKIEEAKSSVLIMRDDQIKEVCQAIDIKIPTLSVNAT